MRGVENSITRRATIDAILEGSELPDQAVCAAPLAHNCGLMASTGSRLARIGPTPPAARIELNAAARRTSTLPSSAAATHLPLNPPSGRSGMFLVGLRLRIENNCSPPPSDATSAFVIGAPPCSSSS